jgi:hypothetical protein
VAQYGNHSSLEHDHEVQILGRWTRTYPKPKMKIVVQRSPTRQDTDFGFSE